MTSRREIFVDDTDSSINYIGSGWFLDQGTQDNVGTYGPAYESTLHGTKSDGSLSFSFNGTQVTVYGLSNVHNDSGVLDPTWECFVDNINIGNTSSFLGTENHWVFCDKDALPDGPHILTMNATVKNQRTFWFDNIEYVPSSSVSLENAAIKLDHRDPELQYGSGWNPYKDGTTATFTQTPNSTFTYSFIGASLSWFSQIPPDLPHAATFGSYSVDNQVPIQFSLKGLPAGTTATMYNQKIFETPEYPMGSHTIVVTYLGNSSTTPLTLEYLVVQNGTFPSNTSSLPTTSGHNTSDPAEMSHSRNVGKIAGGVVGGIVLVILATLSIIYFRRRDPNPSTKPLYNHGGHDLGNAIEPFQLAPSIQPAPKIYSQYSPVTNTVGGQPQHWFIPNQSIKSLNPILPRTLVLGGTPPATGNSGNIPSSHTRTTNIAHLPTPENEVHLSSRYPRREAEASAAALRPWQQYTAQRILVPPPQRTSSGADLSRLVMHEDSGIRLLLPTNNEVVEVPPMYTTV